MCSQAMTVEMCSKASISMSRKDRFTCIVGPNGAGKSTVLRVISGLLKPRLGEVTFNKHSIGGMKPRQVSHMVLFKYHKIQSLP